MSTDPASLNVTVGIVGMDNDEATAVVNNLPAGCTASVAVTKPGVGSKRFAITAEGLSITGAKDMTTALFLHCQRVADSDGGQS